MKNSIHKTALAIAIAFAIGLISHLYHDQYKFNPIFWYVTAFLDCMFWVVIYYPNYRWHKLKTGHKFVLVMVCIRFCCYFLPIDVLSSPLIVASMRIISLLIIFVVVFFWGDNDDDGNDKEKKEVKPKKRKYSFIPQNN
jgi:uncharacterized membrane protein